MCGIAGVVDFKGASSLVQLKHMTDALSHRGPDDSGCFFETYENVNVGLGHRRLSVLDLSTHGHQPMSYADLQIVYNGEVYNFTEIRLELEKLGYHFESNSDTEVILKAYHRWGNESVKLFNGMFAIAIFDSTKQTLTLIRDRAGVKPIYYYTDENVFMFASELKSFHKHSAFNKSINSESLGLFLKYGYIPQPYSIFDKTFKLEAGHILEIKIKTREIVSIKYWDVIDCYNKEKINISEQEATSEVERLLKSACEYRMVADVPVGVFLSGGYDSSAVTALLQSERSERLKTFSIGFNDNKYNEAHHAKKVADFLGTDHTEYYCMQKDAIDIFPHLADIWDEPFADNSVIPTLLVSKLARNNVKVSLSADGGDELFGGYGKYVQSASLFKNIDSLPFRNFFSNYLKKLPVEKLKIEGLIPNFTGKFYKMVSILGSSSQTDTMDQLQQVFTDCELNYILKRHVSVVSVFSDVDRLAESLEDLDKMMAIDYKTYQLDDILTKVDRATMSVGLEGREPLLDYRLIEFVATLPPDLKIKADQKKYLLKKITHKYLPKDIMERPKMGFNMPLLSWLGESFSEQLDYYLHPVKLHNQGLFNTEALQQMKKRFNQGHKNYATKLWTILIFQVWYDRWIAKI